MVIYRQILLPTKYKLICGSDKSFADDLVASGYCKCERLLVSRSTEIFPMFLRFVLSFVVLLNFGKNPVASVTDCGDRVFFIFADFCDRNITISETQRVRSRPYRNERTGSLPNSEVNRCRARLVLGRGTAREVLWVLLAFLVCFYAIRS